MPCTSSIVAGAAAGREFCFRVDIVGRRRYLASDEMRAAAVVLRKQVYGDGLVLG